jgi:hypothetical protein
MGKLIADIAASVRVQRPESPLTDRINLALSLADAEYDELRAGYEEVANGASDQPIALGPLTTAELVLALSDQVVTWKINGSIAIQAGRLLLAGAAVTSLTVSNASGSDANIEIVMLGV